MYQVVIVEDEAEAADNLKRALARFSEEHSEQFQTVWLKSALELGSGHAAPDLIFMDIDMPGINGLDAALELRKHDQATPLIFVTNLAQYAVKGYTANALDFIVKPFTYGDFCMRMLRALEVMKQRQSHSITIKSRDGMNVFPTRDLVMIEVRSHNLAYVLSSGDEVCIRGSLSKVEPELGGSPFLHVSSGCVINMQHIQKMKGDKITLTGNREVWISRSNRKHAFEEITRYLGTGA